MKKLRNILFVIIILLVTIISVGNVKAAEGTISANKTPLSWSGYDGYGGTGSCTGMPGNSSEFNRYSVATATASFPAGQRVYCLDMNTPSGIGDNSSATVTKRSEMSVNDATKRKIIYIMKADSVNGEALSENDNQHYAAKQFAIWAVLNFSSASNRIYNCSADAMIGIDSVRYTYSVFKKAKALLQNANNGVSNVTPELSITGSGDLTIDSSGNYYVSPEITITSSYTEVSIFKLNSIKVSVNNGAEVIDSSENVISSTTNINSGTKVRIRVPKASATASSQYTLTATENFVKYSGHIYSLTTSSQDLGILESPAASTNNKSVSMGVIIEPDPEPEPQTSNIIVRKYDKYTQTLIDGSTFGLYTDEACTSPAIDNNGKTIVVAPTTNGRVAFNDLLDGIYYIKEESHLPNYKPYYEVLKVKLEDGALCQYKNSECVNATNNTVNFYNTPYRSIIINKWNYATKKPQGGAKFKIYTDGNLSTQAKNVDGSYYGEIVATDGTIEITRLPYGTYCIQESSSPAGFAPLNQVVCFNVNANGVVMSSTQSETITEEEIIINDTINFYNAPSNLVISKQDVADQTEIEGAQLELYNCDKGTEDISWISSDSPREFTIQIGETCTLRETLAPEGYEELTSELTFTLKNDGTIEVLEINAEEYKIENNHIIVYNKLEIPNTGLAASIISVVVGISLISVGTYIIIRRNKQLAK